MLVILVDMYWPGWDWLHFFLYKADNRISYAGSVCRLCGNVPSAIRSCEHGRISTSCCSTHSNYIELDSIKLRRLDIGKQRDMLEGPGHIWSGAGCRRQRIFRLSAFKGGGCGGGIDGHRTVFTSRGTCVPDKVDSWSLVSNFKDDWNLEKDKGNQHSAFINSVSPSLVEKP